MKTFFLHILTGPDNKTFEPANAMAFVHTMFTSLAAGAGVVMYLWQHRTTGNAIDLQSFGIGLGAVGVSVSAAIAALGAAQKWRGDADRGPTQ